MKRLLIMLACMVSVAPVYSASFDCTKATTKVEKLVCKNAEISTLDDELDKAYKIALSKSNAEQKQLLGVDQRHWMKDIRDACKDMDCVKLAYQNRIHELISSLAQDAEPTYTADVTKEMSGSWLRLYSDEVMNIGVDAERYKPDQPIPIDAVFVQFRDYHP